MAGIPMGEKAMKLGGSFPSYLRVDRGSLTITTPVVFRGTVYDLAHADLKTGNIQGLEFLFAPDRSSPYEILAHADAEISISKIHLQDLYRMTPEVLFAIIEEYAPTLQSIVETQRICEVAHTTAHRLFHSFIAALGYLSSKYHFGIQEGEIGGLVEEVGNYIKKHQLTDKLFPLSNELFNIHFEELNSCRYGANVVGELYLQRIVSMFDALKEKWGTDRILNLNLLMDLSFKASKSIEMGGKKIQSILEYLEIFLSEEMVSLLRDFFKTASRSEEISRYLLLVVRSVGRFFLQKVIEPINPLNRELNLILQDELSKHNDIIVIIERNIFSSGKDTEQVSRPVPAVLDKTLTHILDFGEIQGETRTKLLEEYNQWKMTPNRMAVDDEISKIRRRLGQIFWDVYTACFKQYKIHGKPLIKPVELFFKYGLWDESIVNTDILHVLLEHSDVPIDKEGVSVFSVYDWLIAVCDQEYSISSSATGEYPDVIFRELLKEADQKSRKKTDLQEVNTLEFRIDHEINNLVREASKICNGMFANYIPMLVQEQFPIVDLSNQILTAARVRRSFMDLRNVDFSAFYREVRYRNDSQNINEFVQKEVLPIFILMPGVGTRSIVWQPKERAKETSARIALPAISFTKPEPMMINVFGFFRWEIVKDILGPSWNDISLLSLTSEYGDYESTYKNSKDLDDEVKERIAQDFKKYRTTRDRFIHDYSRWISIDSQGRPGVNRVVRELFFRQIPFPKDIRTKLSGMPAYEQLNDRYTILIRREIARLKLKYQKYQKEDGSLPPELEGYIRFLAR